MSLGTEVFKRDKWHCRHCNSSWYLHPHHVVYRSLGGEDELNNLLTLCWQCHEAAHRKLLKIEVLEILEDNLIVKFIRLRGWTPV